MSECSCHGATSLTMELPHNEQTLLLVTRKLIKHPPLPPCTVTKDWSDDPSYCYKGKHIKHPPLLPCTVSSSEPGWPGARTTPSPRSPSWWARSIGCRGHRPAPASWRYRTPGCSPRRWPRSRTHPSPRAGTGPLAGRCLDRGGQWSGRAGHPERLHGSPCLDRSGDPIWSPVWTKYWCYMN